MHNYELSDYKGKWVVLFFYPVDFTFVCPTEATGFNRMLFDLESIRTYALALQISLGNFELVSIS
jgi:peroxiredoxin 2/4